MNILLISNFAPPQNHVAVPRIHSWIREWSRKGHNVTVLTTEKVVGIDGRVDGHYLLDEYPPDRVRFIEIPYVRPPLRFNGDINTISKLSRSRAKWATRIRRFAPFFIDKRAFWFFRVCANLDNYLAGTKFDVVVSSFPLSYCHLLASLVARKYGIPWLADYRDAWSSDKLRRAPWPFYLIDYFIERLAVKRAARITAVSPGQAQLIGGTLGRGVEVIYNGSDDPDFATKDEYSTILDKSKILLRYIGTVQSNRLYPYKEFLEACVRLIRDKAFAANELKIEFIGPGSETLMECIESLGLNDYVYVKPSVSMLEAKRLMCESSALIFFDIRSSFGVSGHLSGKIFEYLAARRPVISVGDNSRSDVNQIINASNSGVFFDTNSDQMDLSEALKKLNSISEMAKPNYKSLGQYRRSVQSENALAILNELVADTVSD